MKTAGEALLESLTPMVEVAAGIEFMMPSEP
jgi:hypothetical protein